MRDLSGETIELWDAAATELNRQLQTRIDALHSRHRLALGLTLLAVLLAAAVAYVVSRSITDPLADAVEGLEQLSHKDLSTRMLADDRRTGGELGEIAVAIDRTGSEFGRAVLTIRETALRLAARSDVAMETAEQLSATAEETSAQAGVVSSAAEQVSQNAETVAASVEELTASIREISSNASEAAAIAQEAVTVTDSTTGNVDHLRTSSSEIGEVVQVITSIAEQTNLLALNATIEAARAGEAGKGFAVVAQAVKELSRETATATEDIGRRIEAIQQDTAEAIAGIERISETIARICDYQHSIASAVEEQTVTTREIGQNVGQAASGSREIAENITAVAEAAHHTAENATTARSGAADAAELAEQLNRLVAEFKLRDEIATDQTRA